MPSSNGSSHCSQDSGLSVSWSPRCSSPPSESQVQRHMDDMRNFLESDPIRKLEEPLAGETARPSGEAQAMKDCTSTSSLPNIIGFSPALNDNACLPDMDMDSASTVADDNETHSLSDLYTDITFSEETSTGDLDQPKASGVLGGGFQDYLMPFSKDQDRRCSMDLSDSSLSPIVGRDLAMTYSDSGFCDTSPGAAAHCMSFQESPFMGHDSPDTMFELWPVFGKPADPTFGPRILSDSGTELQPPGFRDDFNDPILYPLSSTPTLSPTTEILPAFPSQMIPIFSSSESASTRSLSDQGVSAIVERLIRPMCMDESLSEFRDVLQQAEMIVRRGKIPSLRDLEKVLVLELGHQPPNCTAASYLRLCAEFFRRSKTLWDCLSDDDLCLPSEQPYDKNYVWDAWHRVVGKAQMRFKIQPHELDRIIQNMRQTIDTSVTWDVSNTRGVRRTSDAASLSPLKSRARKRPRLTADSCSFSQASPGASAAQTTGIKRMQPPPNRASPPTTNNLSRHPPSHISTGLPTETRVVSQPLSTSTWRYNEVTSQLTSEVQLRQMQEHRTPIVTQTVAMGEAKRVGLAPPTPDSPATLAQSDASVSPGPHRKRNAAKPTEHSHSFACDKCPKGFRRACDLKKHVKTHDRPFKCTVHACAYFITGFSAEKDRDRHFTDKHDKNTPKKMCKWNCGYSSPRESNVKQHMEKAHGYIYVRTKSVQKGNKSPRVLQGKGRTRSDPSPRPAKTRRRSVPAPTPQPEKSSASTTPMMQSTGYIPSDSSPLFDLDTISPETLAEEPSPAQLPPRNYFHDLSLVMPRRSPPSLGIAPSYIHSPGAMNSFEYKPLFQDPSGAVQAMNVQHSGSRQSPYNYPQELGHATFCMNANAKPDAPLVGEALTPDPDFADHFLRDAPSNVLLELIPHPAIDPGLPIVPNLIFDPSKDRDYP